MISTVPEQGLRIPRYDIKRITQNGLWSISQKRISLLKSWFPYDLLCRDHRSSGNNVGSERCLVKEQKPKVIFGRRKIQYLIHPILL